MSIITEPFYNILVAYRPVKFIAEITVDSTVYVAENAVVEIYKNGVLLTTVRYKVATTTPVTPPDVEYTFNIDIQKYCQDSLAPNTDVQKPLAFAEIGSDLALCTDGYAEYYISVTYEGVNITTGLLEDMGITADVSNDMYVFYSSKQHLETMDLLYYYGTVGSQDGHCLTKSSESLEVCRDDNAYLTYINPSPQGNNRWMRVRGYDSAAALLFGAVANNSNLLQPTTAVLLSKNVGAESLNTTNYTSGTVDFDDPDLAYYTVSFGFGLPSFNQHTNEYTFTLKKCCERASLRFHWLNLLGGVDSYTFDSEKDYQIKTNSETGRKALEFSAGEQSPHSPNDFGGFKYNSKASTSFKLRSRYLTNTQATWLQDLLVSPKVYVDLEGQLVPVLIEDTDQSIDRQNGRIRYEITAKMANDLIIQRV